jgi:hypothetical protein
MIQRLHRQTKPLFHPLYLAYRWFQGQGIEAAARE